MNSKLSFLVFFLAIMLFGCSNQKENIEIVPDGIIYSNSFENAMDLEDFEGMEFNLSSDTPVGGGDSSLVVSGGCLVPHLYFELGPFDETQHLSFSIYGKAQDIFGGTVMLSLLNDPHTNISIEVQHSDWTLYETANSIEVPVGEKINVVFQSGGIIEVTTLFDLLEIKSD